MPEPHRRNAGGHETLQNIVDGQIARSGRKHTFFSGDGGRDQCDHGSGLAGSRGAVNQGEVFGQEPERDRKGLGPALVNCLFTGFYIKGIIGWGWCEGM